MKVNKIMKYMYIKNSDFLLIKAKMVSIHFPSFFLFQTFLLQNYDSDDVALDF